MNLSSQLTNSQVQPQSPREIWNQDATTVLIMAYETYPNLYFTRDPEYKLKNRRADSLQNVRRILMESGVDVSVEEINKKIHSLRTNFFKEYAKMKKSLVSGAGLEDVYKPTLWCYDLLHFLIDSDPVRRSSSNLDNMENVKPGCSGIKKQKMVSSSVAAENEDPEIGNDEEMIFEGPTSELEKGVYIPPITPTTKKVKKTAGKNVLEKEALNIMTNAANVLNNFNKQHEKTRNDSSDVQDDIKAFGSVIMEELKKIMDENELRLHPGHEMHAFSQDACQEDAWCETGLRFTNYVPT